MYALSADAGGRAYLSWLEPLPDKVWALRFAVFEHGRWGSARTVAQSASWFVNWADHPSVAALDDGTLAAHWLANTNRKAGSYGYAIHVALSRDQGATWADVFTAGLDNVEDYSGFVTLAPGPAGFDMAYLTPPSGSDHGKAEHAMTLSHVFIGRDGRAGTVSVLDADTCTCCTTSVARLGDDLVVAYRDHAPGEVRDISVARTVGRACRWLADQRLPDEWTGAGGVGAACNDGVVYRGA